MFYRTSNAIIAPDLSRDLNLSPRDLGFLGAVFFYAFALIQIPLGFLLDSIGAKITMIILNIIGMIGTLIFASAGDLTASAIGRGLLGLGMGANLMGSFKIFIRWFDARMFATVSGLAISIGTLGSIASTSPLALLVQVLGWRGSFYALTGINVCLTLCLLFFVDESPPNNRNAHPAPPKGPSQYSLLLSARTLFRNRNYWAISFSVFLRYGAFAAIQALWAGPFLMEYLGLPAITAGNVLLALNIGFIIGAPLGGMISDRVLKSRKKAVIQSMFFPLIAVLILAHWTNSTHLQVLGAIFFFLGFFSAFNQISYIHIKELMPGEMAGTAMTGINFFIMMGAGVFIHGLGGIMEIMGIALSGTGQGYRVTFMICASALFISLILYTFTKDSILPKKGHPEA